MSSGEEKTEKPTAKKKKESRKEGQVPRSQEIGAWAALLVLGLVLPLLVEREIGALRALMARALRLVAEPDPAKAMALLGDGLMHTLLALVVLGSAVMVVGVAGALSQGGFYLATKAVKPKWSKLNPIQGAKRVFGTQALWEGAKVLVKSTVVALVVWSTIRSMMPMIGGMVPTTTVISVASGEAMGLIRNIALAGLVMAGADYAFQRHKVGKQTRMTKQEVKTEHKQQEGDPLLKGAIRSRQLAAARNRMMADVLQADVVLVNPTHVAVALRYDSDAGAPTVVARGAGAIAARIREKAAEGSVPLVRDVPLARALYTSCRVGQEIPPELFAAVAQVLAFVISRRRHGQAGGEHTTPRADDALPTVPRVRPRRATLG